MKPIHLLIVVVISLVVVFLFIVRRIGAQALAVSTSATTTTFTPGALLLSGCATQATSVPGAAAGQLVVATPAVDLGAGVVWTAWVSSPGNVTIRQCALLSITPTPTTFMVKVLQ